MPGAPWTQAEQFQLLLLIIQQSIPKPDWEEIAPKMGKTVSLVTQQFNKLKKMSATTADTGGNAGPAATPKKRAIKTATGSAKKKAKIARDDESLEYNNHEDHEHLDVNPGTQKVNVETQVKGEKVEDYDDW